MLVLAINRFLGQRYRHQVLPKSQDLYVHLHLPVTPMRYYRSSEIVLLALDFGFHEKHGDFLRFQDPHN